MKEKNINFRGFKKVYMVTVLEGKGTEENPYREVRYIYDDEEDRYLGNIDCFTTPSCDNDVMKK